METAFFDLPESPRISVLSWPTRIVVGAGALKRLPDEVRRLGLQRPLVVTDAGVTKAGLLDRVLAVLGEAGIVHVLFDRVKPDPTEPDVFAGLEAYRTGACDGIVALGGGSPLDAAKLVQLLTSHAPPLATREVLEALRHGLHGDTTWRGRRGIRLLCRGWRGRNGQKGQAPSEKGHRGLIFVAWLIVM